MLEPMEGFVPCILYESCYTHGLKHKIQHGRGKTWVIVHELCMNSISVLSILCSILCLGPCSKQFPFCIGRCLWVVIFKFLMGVTKSLPGTQSYMKMGYLAQFEFVMYHICLGAFSWNDYLNAFTCRFKIMAKGFTSV